MHGDLINKLKLGRKNVRTLNFPGTDVQVQLRVLTNGEKQAALFAAESHFKAHGIEFAVQTSDAYQDEINTQILHLALVDPSIPGVTLFGNAAELRENLMDAAKAALIDVYNELDAECNPSVEELSEERYEAILEDAKKKPEVLNTLSTASLKRLLLYSASRRVTLQPAS